MSCLRSLTKYKRDCKGVTGGVQKLWMVSYSDLAKVSGSLLNYAVDSTGNMVNEIGLAVSKKFVEVGLLKNTVGVTENLTKTSETNAIEISTELTLVIANISVESRTFVTNLVEAGEVAAIIQLRSGKFIAIGLDGYTEVSAVAGGSGVAGADLNGYTITISGTENELMKLVDPLIITTIVE